MSKAYDRAVSNRIHGLGVEDFKRYTPAVLATRPWNGVSARYKQAYTTDVIAELAKAGYACVQAMQSNSRVQDKSGYTRHQLTFRAVDKLGWVEEVPEIVVINDHSASAAYAVMAGYFRLICQNGLILVDTASDILKVRHTGTVIQEVLDATFAIASQMESKLAAISQMKQIILSPAERLQLAELVALARYGEPKVVEGSIEGVPFKDRLHPDALLIPRSLEDQGMDLWHTYNTAQFRGINGGVRIKGYDRARKVTALDSQLRINVAAWQASNELRMVKVG